LLIEKIRLKSCAVKRNSSARFVGSAPSDQTNPIPLAVEMRLSIAIYAVSHQLWASPQPWTRKISRRNLDCRRADLLTVCQNLCFPPLRPGLTIPLQSHFLNGAPKIADSGLRPMRFPTHCTFEPVLDMFLIGQSLRVLNQMRLVSEEPATSLWA
jgi:hypothetical protein